MLEDGSTSSDVIVKFTGMGNATIWDHEPGFARIDKTDRIT